MQQGKEGSGQEAGPRQAAASRDDGTGDNDSSRIITVTSDIWVEQRTAQLNNGARIPREPKVQPWGCQSPCAGGEALDELHPLLNTPAQTARTGTPVVDWRLTNPTGSQEDSGSVLASFSGLRIWRCQKLGCRSQMRLRSCVAVAVVEAGSCSSD